MIKTWFILIWLGGGLCRQGGEMSPCEGRRVFDTKEAAINYAKENVANSYEYNHNWSKSQEYQLWEVKGTSSSLIASRIVETTEKP